MTYRKNIQILLASLFIVDISLAFDIDTQNHPKVGDWKDAVNSDGLVRIPLSNPKGHSWFASLQMGTPLQHEQRCVFDNNHNLSAVFGVEC